MKGAAANVPVKDFPVPPGIYRATICLDSGLLARENCPRTTTDIFTEATLPKKECNLDHRTSRPSKENQKKFILNEKDRGKKVRF
jgi:membrane carboxypeptidase/penicillin-binding protein